MYYLYRHIRLDKNEPFYVGIGTKPIKYKNYISEYDRAFKIDGRNSHWINITSKTDYDVEIIYETNIRGIILEKEKEFIALYGRKDKNKCPLVNFTDGGEGRLCSITSDETKLKLREYNLGKPMPAHVNIILQKSRIGKTNTPEAIRKSNETKFKNGTNRHKPEAKEKMRLQKLGTKMPLKTKEAIVTAVKRPIIKLPMNGEEIEEFPSLKEAALNVGKKYNNLIACAKGLQNSCGGFKWKYK